MKTYDKILQTKDGEALADELTTFLELGDKLVSIGDANTPAKGVRKFTFETEDSKN